MDYKQWIERERRIRYSLIVDRLNGAIKGTFRTCSVCGEVCMCDECRCPNCNSDYIIDQVLDVNSIKDRIRCRYRYAGLGND